MTATDFHSFQSLGYFLFFLPIFFNIAGVEKRVVWSSSLSIVYSSNIVSLISSRQSICTQRTTGRRDTAGREPIFRRARHGGVCCAVVYLRSRGFWRVPKRGSSLRLIVYISKLCYIARPNFFCCWKSFLFLFLSLSGFIYSLRFILALWGFYEWAANDSFILFINFLCCCFSFSPTFIPGGSTRLLASSFMTTAEHFGKVQPGSQAADQRGKILSQVLAWWVTYRTEFRVPFLFFSSSFSKLSPGSSLTHSSRARDKCYVSNCAARHSHEYLPRLPKANKTNEPKEGNLKEINDRLL